MPKNPEITRTAIIDSAQELFATRGYDSVRIEDVARAAGVSRATFYNHFSDREQILAALLERLIGADAEEFTQPDQPPPLERVTHVTRDAVARMLRQRDLARLIYRLPVRHETLLDPQDSSTPTVFRQIHALLEQAAARGELRDDVPIDVLCAHVHNALESAMRAWAEGRTHDPGQRVEMLVDLALHGITKQRANGS